MTTDLGSGCLGIEEEPPFPKIRECEIIAR